MEADWIGLPRYSEAYVSGIQAFVENAFPLFSVGEEMKCPCKKCNGQYWHRQDVIYDHLICRGPSALHVQWIYDVSQKKVENSTANIGSDFMDCETGYDFGDNLEAMGKMFENLDDGPDTEAKKIYRHLKEGKQPLYPGCKKFSRLSFMIRLYHLKCSHGISNSAFGELLGLIKDAFPEANMPLSFNAAKDMIRDLGLHYEKIHACPNSCMLYWEANKNKQVCDICGVSRWVIQEKKGSAHNNDPEKLVTKVPANVMRYFPLKPRLQRLFLSKESSKLNTWHAAGRTKDGKLRHPADAETWKTMDAMYPDFSSEIRNISLGVAADGFNPFRSMNLSHSTWPILLVNYNLPPWLCMKQENLILSTLISGPESPGNSIDVYMQPLIAELKELWDVGIQTYDALTDHNFNLRARVLWTISDFPGYAMLSGWSTKGRLACPICHYETCSEYLKHSRKMCYMNHRKYLDPSHKWRFDKKRFNGQIETRQIPDPLTGKDIEELLFGFENQFGKKRKGMGNRKRKIDSPFKKRSIFFNLSYWKHVQLRHNLDAMHIEKNLCDNILGTLLNIGGMSKDHLGARFDLQEMGIRKSLHPVKGADGETYEIMASIFDMTDKEKDVFCKLLKNVKLPYGCAANISRYVHTDERKVVGYKSHDAHFILHYLLQFAAKKSLKPEVAKPLIKLSEFLRGLWSKVIVLDDIERLQEEIVEILCEFEIIFPPAFFDIMVHLPVHLCNEVKCGGPVHLRCMYPIERYLAKLKSYVRNRSKPEGSIAEGYLAEECITFCSRFLLCEEAKENTDFGRCPTNVTYHIGTRRNKDGKVFQLEDSEWKACHTYTLFNSGNKEIEALLE